VDDECFYGGQGSAFLSQPDGDELHLIWAVGADNSKLLRPAGAYDLQAVSGDRRCLSSMEVPPVLILAFNRPGPARRIFMAVRLARPARLFIACDGPRAQKAGEEALVAEVRDLVKLVDWPCVVETRFLEKNLGCGKAVSSAIEWFLDRAGEGVILEDDCLPSPAFFRFAAVMLERYRHDERIALISGSNMAGLARIDGEYAFSRVISCWGWATWKRTWDRYSLSIPEIGPDEQWARTAHPRMITKLNREIRRTTGGSPHTWDYQLLVQCFRSGQLTVVPRWNLVLNIGFDGDGAHYGAGGRPWAVPAEAHNPAADWSRVEPVMPHAQYDAHYLACGHRGSGVIYRQWLKLRLWLARLMPVGRP
jgi:hypothetical protein